MRLSAMAWQNALLRRLRSDPQFWGTCPSCRQDFRLIHTQLFSLKEPLPELAFARIRALKRSLQQRRKALRDAKARMTTRAAITAEAVSLGKICEKIAPSFASFPFVQRDCRCLLEPIDFLVFSGLSSGRVQSITFLELKTGRARLSDCQKDIARVVAAGRVQLELIPTNDECHDR
jgi:predicted Holliday junction resolvase-like endonuclease